MRPGQWSHNISWDADADVYDHRDGTYDVSWSIATYPSAEWPAPSVAYAVNVHVNDVDVANWTVDFDVGLHLDPNTSTSIGPGAGSVGIDSAKLYTLADSTATVEQRRRPGGPRLLAGEMTEMNIQARTVEGWALRVGGPEVHLSSSPEGSIIAWRALDRGDGSFDVSYIPTKGPNNVSIALSWPRFGVESTLIADQPAQIYVFPGPAHQRTSAPLDKIRKGVVAGTSTVLTVQSRDVFGNDAIWGLAGPPLDLLFQEEETGPVVPLDPCLRCADQNLHADLQFLIELVGQITYSCPPPAVQTLPPVLSASAAHFRLNHLRRHASAPRTTTRSRTTATKTTRQLRKTSMRISQTITTKQSTMTREETVRMHPMALM